MSLADKMRAKKQALADGKAGSSDLKSSIKARKEKANNKKASMRDRMRAKADLKETDDDDDEEELDDEELAEAISEAQERFNELVKRVQLTSIVEETTSLGNDMIDLPEKIAAVRGRGYKFRNYLEGKIEVMAEKWDGINDRIETWLEEESADLDDELAEAEAAYRKLQRRQSQKYLDRLTNALDTLETQVEASEEKIEALYNKVHQEMKTTNTQLTRINQQLDWLDAADVSLKAGEGLYMAAEAEWDDNRDKPDGFIYVTDQRVIFEQSEKKGGMMGFGGKQVKEVLWEVSHDQIDDVIPANEGFGGGKDMMTLKLSSGNFSELVAEIKGGIEADYWAQQLKRATKGLILEESAIEPDPELIERLRNAPTECPNCGGVMPKLNAGANEITCEYCGSMVRI